VIRKLQLETETEIPCYVRKSSYTKNVNVIAWILRFVNATRYPKVQLAKTMSLNIQEKERTEVILLQLVQKEPFG